MSLRRKKRSSKGASLGIRKVIAKVRNVRVVASPKDAGKPFRGFLELSENTVSVCVIRAVGGIGDVLMITPGIRALKEKYPQVKITVAVDRHRVWDDSYFNLLSNAWFIHDVIDARYVDKRKFDEVVNISAVCIPYERKGLPAINRIDLFARHLGINFLEDPVPFLKIEEEESIWAALKIELNKISKDSLVVSFAPTSNEGKRSWSNKQASSFLKEMILKSPNALILFFDFQGNFDKKLLENKNILDCSSTSVREMASLIGQSDIYVGPDSGPMHIAGALGVKSIALFGSIPPEARVNYYKNHEAIVSETVSCLGCWYAKCPYEVKCMDTIESSLIVSEVIRRSLEFEYASEI